MFDRLREEAGLPSTLEERIVASLEERGLLRRYRSRIDRRALATAVLAAVVGFAAGGWFERPRTPPGPRWVLLLYLPAGRVDASPGRGGPRARVQRLGEGATSARRAYLWREARRRGRRAWRERPGPALHRRGARRLVPGRRAGPRRRAADRAELSPSSPWGEDRAQAHRRVKDAMGPCGSTVRVAR